MASGEDLNLVNEYQAKRREIVDILLVIIIKKFSNRVIAGDGMVRTGEMGVCCRGGEKIREHLMSTHTTASSSNPHSAQLSIRSVVLGRIHMCIKMFHF